MVLPASLWLFYKNLVNIDQEWSGQPGLVVYLEIHANDGEIKRTLEELQSLKDLRDLYIVPADQALKRFGYLTGVGDLKELLGANPLPFSIQGYLANDVEYFDYEKLRKKIKKMPHIDDVVLEIEWLENLREITGLVNLLLIVYVILFAIASAFISFTSIKIAIEDRLTEVKILKLVGATNAQIRRPFLS
jgi:cell division transport system permease protein